MKQTIEEIQDKIFRYLEVKAEATKEESYFVVQNMADILREEIIASYEEDTEVEEQEDDFDDEGDEEEEGDYKAEEKPKKKPITIRKPKIDFSKVDKGEF